MAFQFNKAERKRVKLRIALIGPSGSGKTYTALRLAKGMGGKTALIDTENRRSEYYANEFDFEVLHLDPPFTPERYVEAITAAEEAGFDNLIIDSASHEWIGKGGILEDKAKMPDKNDFTKWDKLTPRHNLFIEKIIRCNVHLFITLRGKDEYVLVTDESTGKSKPKKLGIGAQQRDGLEYECTAAFLIDQEKHVAEATKDNTHLFDGKCDVLTEEHGKLLSKWASEGLEMATPVQINELAELAKVKKVELKLVWENWTGKRLTKDITTEDYNKVKIELDKAAGQ